VEKRKKQFELWESLRTSQLEIIFAGPIVDERVIHGIATDPKLTDTFIGPISRENLITELGKYSSLILISDGEADALVLYEAQLAGLPVLVTERSLGSQNPELDWICVISESPTAEEIHSALTAVISSPLNISKYALENYSWPVRNKKLVTLLLELSK
jgi:glycosyltransferase involved in cell wall biosynthesis